VNKYLKLIAVMAFSVVMAMALNTFFQLFFSYLLYAIVFAAECLLACLAVARLTAARIRRALKAQLDQFLALFLLLCAPLLLCLATAPFWLHKASELGTDSSVQVMTEGAEIGLLVGFMISLKVLADELTKDKVLRQARTAIAEARRLMGLEEFQDASDKLCEALVAAEVQFGSVHEQPAKLAQALAELYLESKEPDRSAAMYRRALFIYEQMLGNRSTKVADCIVQLSQVESADTDPDGTIVLLRRALSIREQQLSSSDPGVGIVLQYLSELLARKERWEEAEEYGRRALELSKRQPNPSGVEINTRTNRLALLLTRTGRKSEAERMIVDGLQQRIQQNLPATPETISMQLELARIYASLGKIDQLNEQVLEAIRLLQNEVGPDHPALKPLLEMGLDRLGAGLPQPEWREFFETLMRGDSMSLRKRVEANRDLLISTDATGWQALQWATFLGLDRIAEALVHGGAGLETPDWAPLHIATRWSQRRVIPILMQKGADPSSLAGDGSSLLHQCARAGDDRLIDTFFSKGAPLNAVNREGFTALHIASRDGFTRVAVEFVARHADIKQLNLKNGWSALHYASAGGHLAIVECLLLNGASQRSIDQNGKTASDVAAENQHTSVVEILKEHSR
jgi:tetratricopeptide (TPR) repeat protein